jgi:predicted transcriptional regulator
MGDEYHPKVVTKRILKVLCDSEVETPTGIGRKTGYDGRTIAKYVEMLEGLGIVKCKEIPMGKRKVKACSLADESKCQLLEE